MKIWSASNHEARIAPRLLGTSSDPHPRYPSSTGARPNDGVNQTKPLLQLVFRPTRLARKLQLSIERPSCSSSSHRNGDVHGGCYT